MTKSIEELQARQRATRDWQRVVALMIAFAALGFLAAAVFAQTAHAQTVLQPGQSITIRAAAAPPPIHDTVTKIVARCYNAAMQVITCPTTPPVPPDSTPPSGTHEPVGMVRVTERPFSALVEDGWSPMTEYTNKNGYFTISQDATAPKSPSSVGDFRYPANWTAGSAPADLFHGAASGCGTTYISYWFKYSSNWFGHSSGVAKQVIAWSDNQPTAVLTAWGSGTAPLSAWINIQGTGGSRNMKPNVVPSATFSRGEWHRFEAALTSNTAGGSNGVARWWLDGVLVGNYTDVRYNSGSSNWSQYGLTSNFGGIGGTTPSYDMHLWLDHFYASCKA